jgi:mediator of RNA polymerase II transcription subunit 13
MHVSILCVEHNVPWSFLEGQYDIQSSSVTTTSRNLSKELPLFVDISTSTYAMPAVSFPLPPALDLAGDLHYIPDLDNNSPQIPTLSIRSLSSTALLRLSTYTPNSPLMIRIHFLHIFKSPRSSLVIPDGQTHRDVTRNYYQLALLADIRWRLGDKTQLPFHLAAIDTMRTALQSSEYGCD